MADSWLNRFEKRHSRPRHLPTPLCVEQLEERLAPAITPITLADTALFGDSANNTSARPSISADGQLVAFESLAGNLVTNDLNGVADVYVRDSSSGSAVLVSVALTGSAGNGASQNARISADGRYVVFESEASDLVPGDTNSARDIFRRDLVTQTTIRVSVDSSGNETVGGITFPHSSNAVISTDGRYIAFESNALNLGGTDTNGNTTDIFLRDVEMSSTTLVSATGGPMTTGSQPATGPKITPDGRFVVFVSNSSVYVRDTQLDTAIAASIRETGALGNGANPVISPDGRFVAFESTDDQMTAVTIADFASDIFRRDLINQTTTHVSLSSSGIDVGANAVNTAMSDDGTSSSSPPFPTTW